MAYSKTPTTDTFSQEDITITREWTSRQNDPLGIKDETFINCFVEVVKDRRLQDSRIFIYKRAGTSTYHTPAVSGDIRGSYYWKDKKKFYYCVGTTVYIYNVSAGTTSSVVPFTSTSGTVGFCTFLYEDTTSSIVVSDGTKLATISASDSLTISTSADLPVPHIPKPIFLDGYIFLVKSTSASIYNSNLDDPIAFTSGDFITAEMDGDNILDIEKLNNYLVVFGTNTIEYFWDVGIETGSPLKRNDTPVKINGFIGGIAKSGNSLFYIGYNENEQVDVFKLQDFTIEEQSSETIRRYLSSLTSSVSAYKAFLVSNLGHTFYIINAGPRTFVYDINEKFWSKWAYKTGDSFDIDTANTFVTATGNKTVFSLTGSTVLYQFDNTKYQDVDTNFITTITTEPNDFGTINRKSMSRLAIFSDRPTNDSFISISFSDNDFVSWYGNYNINLNQDLPSVTRCGNFRQRAIKLTYQDNYPMRIQKLQAFINKGRS